VVSKTKSIKEMISFLTKTVVKRMEPNQHVSITEEGHVVHCHVRSDGLGATVTTDLEYPPRVAHGLITTVLDDFVATFSHAWRTCKIPFAKELDQYLQDYHDGSMDKITKIQKDLDDTKLVLHKTIESMLDRGTQLDKLIADSNDLSAQSKVFYRQAKKTNRCCVIS
jgi:synaptobrevin family protein YKT6